MEESTIKLINSEFVMLARGGVVPAGAKSRVVYGAVLTGAGKVVAPSFDGHAIPSGPDAKNNPLAPQRLREILGQFRKLPQEERMPSSDQIPAGWKNQAYPEPPRGGIVLRQYLRRLIRDEKGMLHREGMVEHDSLWLTEAEWRALVPSEPRPGDTFAIPDFLYNRIGLHHADVLEGSTILTLKGKPQPGRIIVETVFADEVRLRLGGGSFRVDIAANFGTVDYKSINGSLRYNPKTKSVSAFDLAIVGDVSNARAYEHRLTDGRALVGALFFELGSTDRAFDRLPPSRCAFGGLKHYFEPTK